MMVDDNQSGFGTAFTVSIEAAKGITTGISAADRAHTIRTAVAKDATAKDLVRPGHIFPLRARPGGVLVRTGQTEGSVDLARLAGLEPAGVICEIMNEDGTMSRLPDLVGFAQRHGLKIGTISDLKLNSETYRAESILSVRNEVRIPDDSALAVASEGLLGGSFVEVIPGASLDYLEAGDEIIDTQGSVSLIQLLLKFVSSGQN